jgi:hypothetical protein
VWFAAVDRAAHYDWDPERETWVDDRDGDDLYVHLANVVGRKLAHLRSNSGGRRPPRARRATTSRITGPTRNGTTERSLEPQKSLTHKQEILARYQSDPVRSRSPLVDPERFYRNYVEMKDDPKTLDRKALFLTKEALSASLT